MYVRGNDETSTFFRLASRCCGAVTPNFFYELICVTVHLKLSSLTTRCTSDDLSVSLEGIFLLCREGF